MLAHRVPALLTIAVLALLVLVYSFLLLRSTDLAVALFVLGVALVVLVLEPFVGLTVYVLFIYTGPQAYVPALAELRIMLVIGGATLGSMLARRVVFGSQEHGRVRTPQAYLLGWFIAAVVASRLAHLEISEAGTAAQDTLDLVVLFALILNLVNTRRRVHQIFVVILVGTVALAVQGILQNVLGGGFFEWQEFKQGRVAGIGHFVNPNMLAIGLVCGVPVAASLFRETRNLVGRILIALALASMIYALYLTNSRSGMLSLCVVAGVAFARRYGLLAGVAITAVTFFVVVQFGPSRMAELSTTEASARGRILAWEQGYRIFTENPVFGAGAGAWYEKYRTLVAHNSFIHCAAELGVFGLAAWVMLIVVSVRNLWFISRHRNGADEAISSYASALLLAFFAFIFASFFISKTYHVLLFLLLGMAAAVARVYVAEADGQYRLITRADWVLGLITLVVGLAGFRAFLAYVGVAG